MKGDRAWLAANLPHQGRMNLLESIIAWDGASVHAIARGHRDPLNPLRRGGELPIACGIEYGAQAAAAHGALAAGKPSGPGFLASVRAVEFHAPRLDDIEGDLDIRAEQVGDSEQGVLYRFEVASAGRALLEGRLAVAFPR